MEGGRWLGGGCSAAQGLAPIVHEGRAEKEAGGGGAIEQRVRGWLYVAAMTRFLMRAGLVISGGVAAASYSVVVACASSGA